MKTIRFLPLIFALIGNLDAAEKTLPAGIIIAYTGNSYHHLVPEVLDACVKAAGISGHRKVQVPGVRAGYLGRLDGDTPVAVASRNVLKEGVDVHVHSHHWAEFTTFTVKPGLEGNPKFRFYHTMSWLPQTAGASLTDAATITEKQQKNCEVEADKVNKTHGGQVAFLIPTSQAVIHARQLILDGKLPGVKRELELFTGTPEKPDGHPSVITGVLNGYCTFAAVYRTSPEGLKIDIGRPLGLSDELHAALQRIAWGTVSKYPPAGVAK